MAVQITGRQIANSAVGVSKLDLSTGTFDFTNAILQVATPAEGDAANRVASKGYVDGVAQGLDIKDSCKAATTGNITLSGTQTIDGVSIGAGDRVLVKDQSTQTENGIYVAAASGWARAADFATGAAEAGAFTFVEQGTVNGDNGFVCTSDKGSDVVGTNNIVFSQFSGAGQITAGSGLSKSGNTLSVEVDDSSIEISSDALRVKASGVTNAILAGSIANAKLANSSVSFGGVSLALGASDATPAFDLADATNYPTSSLVGTITNAQLAGSIANSKLSNSTISGVALGANLNALTAGNGISMSSYNGSAAVSDLTIDLDGATLAVGSNGIKIADLGVGTSQLAATSVTTAKIASSAITADKISNASIKTEKLDFAGFFQGFDANGSTLAFELAGPVDLEFKQFFTVTVNGLVMEYKDTPDAQDNYKIDNAGTGGAGRIVFGANLANGDRVTIKGFINN